MPSPVTARGPAERREPLPGLLSLPAHLIRKLGPRARRALALAGVVTIAAAALAAVKLVPEIRETKRENEARDRREAAATLAAERRRLTAEQRPRSRRAPGAPFATLQRRQGLVARLERAVTADARRRVTAGQLSAPAPTFASCETVRYTVDALADRKRRFGRFSCTAVTSELPGGEGVIGHPFRARVDFQRGRYTWCKVSGRAGEGGFVRRALVPVPRACTG